MDNQEAIEKFKKIKRGNIFLIHQRIEGKEVIEDYSLCDMAISALEKQIPKKPIRNVGHINPVWVEDAYLCPICFSWAGSIGFCSRCGQAIDRTRMESDDES